jgi:hypothetical protein
MARSELATCFEHTTMPHGDDGKRVRSVIARCGSCEAAIPLPVNTMAHGYAETAEVEWKFISRKLEAKGWQIGRRRQDHRCPRCQRNARLDSGERYVFENPKNGKPAPVDLKLVRQSFMNSATPDVLPEKQYPPLKLVEEPKVEKKKASLHPPGHDGRDLPRQMSRDDRRIIFEKLNEVYVNEKVGYSDGWTDERVATDLGVPRAWVCTIRDENFGDELASESIRKTVQEARDLMVALTRVRGELSQEIAKAKMDIDAADRLERQLAEIAKVLR